MPITGEGLYTEEFRTVAGCHIKDPEAGAHWLSRPIKPGHIESDAPHSCKLVLFMQSAGDGLVVLLIHNQLRGLLQIIMPA